MKTEKDIEEMLDNVKIPSDEEVEAAGVRFDRRLRRVRMRRRIIWSGSSVAAVLCCGFVFASLWVHEKEEMPEATKVVSVIKMDHEFAVPTLILADGNSLNLKEKKAVRRLPLSTQRLVNLAVALLGNPDMIILDDPFSGLDKGECEHLLSVLNYLHEINHTTLLISGQDYTLLSRLASKYGVMADGKLLCELTAGELKKSCQRCIKIRTPQLERAITILSQQFPDFEVLGHDLIRIFHCNEQSGEINTLLVHSGIEVSEIWLAGMEPTDYLLKMTGGAKSDSDDAK